MLCLGCEPSSKTFETADAGPGDSGQGAGGGTAGRAAGAGGMSSGSGGTGDGPGSGGDPTPGTGGSEVAGSSSGSSGTESGGDGGAPEGSGGSTSGASGAGSAGMTGGGISIDNGPAEIARVLCDKLFDCCTDAELEALPLSLGESESSCQIGVAVYLAVIVEASKESIAAGRIHYDGVALEACLDRYRNDACGVLETLDLSVCPDVFMPQIELGEACGISAECIDGYCEGASDATNPVGECAEKKPDGATCAANDECQSGLCEALGDGCVPVSKAPVCGG